MDKQPSKEYAATERPKPPHPALMQAVVKALRDCPGVIVKVDTAQSAPPLDGAKGE